MRVLFVCSGNICRSPMAAAYLRHRSQAAGERHVLVDSAGTLGIEGAPASDEAIEVLAEQGIDLKTHRSRGLTAVEVRNADLIVVMTLAHLEELERRFPEGRATRRLIRAYDASPEPKPGPPDLEDPIGEPIEVYRKCFGVIRRCVDHLFLQLKHER